MTNFNNHSQDTRNNLNLNRYIISEALHFSLESGKLRTNSKNTLNINKFYVVMVRVLNNESKVLVYNYISYPYMFFFTFLTFITTRNIHSSINTHIHRQADDFLSIFQDRLNISDVKDKLFISKESLDIEKVLSNLSHFPHIVTKVEIFKLINRLIMLVNLDSISKLTCLAITKNYKIFVKEILGSLDGYPTLVKYLDDDDNDKSLSIINGCIFVVEDIEKFIEAIKKHNYNINTGPQKHRGQVNSMNNNLSMLDMEYRKSLYNHNNYHAVRGNISSMFKLNRQKFSFNNIHMNLGETK